LGFLVAWLSVSREEVERSVWSFYDLALETTDNCFCSTLEVEEVRRVHSTGD
jgi:hypothetical protein